MQLSSHYVGLRLKPYRTQVTARRAMNYAAAVGDANPLYFDDEREGGTLAPPMLSSALTWPVSSQIWDYLDAPDFPTQVLLTQVHYGEHLAFHQPLRPSQRLVVRGQVAAILPHRAGTLVVVCYEAQQVDGPPVFTEFITGLLRGVECMGEGQGQENLPVTPAAPVGVDPLWETQVAIDPLASYVYDAGAEVHFPIHSSPNFARQVGLPGIIYQGTATLAQAAHWLVDREAGGDPSRLKVLACRFGAMVRPGSTIQVRLLGGEADEGGRQLFFEVLNAAGERAVRDGYACMIGG
jgi:acyl dehydratase